MRLKQEYKNTCSRQCSSHGKQPSILEVIVELEDIFYFCRAFPSQNIKYLTCTFSMKHLCMCIAIFSNIKQI